MACKSETWMAFAPQCMSDAGWELAAETREARLAHRSCPWGGHLIKLEVPTLFIEDGPEDPSKLFVRPEVRHLLRGPMDTKLEHLETYAPGDALLERSSAMWIVRVAAALFGHCQGSCQDHWLSNEAVRARYQLYRNAPETGDCVFVASEAIYMARRLPNSQCYHIAFVFHTPLAWTPWEAPFLQGVAQMFYSQAQQVLNGPRYQYMRAIDAKMYLVLSMRTFNRGPPMVPWPQNSSDLEDSFRISAGEHLGLAAWVRFKPDKKFRLSDYLQCFMEQLGHELKTYEVMDGQKLVPYQCVVLRHQWNQLKPIFLEAFRVQKAAYRHANGGSSTPTLVEDGRPRIASPRLEPKAEVAEANEIMTFFV